MSQLDVVELLRNMIQLQTVNPPGNEVILASFVKDLLAKHGIASTVQVFDGHRANFIADLGNDDGDMLIFQGHMDVVPAAGKWKYPPFEGVVDAGKVFGRGSCDMKGGLSAMLCAFLRLAEVQDKFAGKLRLLFVSDEESLNAGLHHYAATLSSVDRNRRQFAVIGEPTGLALCRGHLGVERFWIHFHGTSAHSSKPEEGKNAIGMAVKFYDAIESYNRRLRSHVTFSGSPSCVVTLVEGGEKMNSVPAECKVMIDRRTVSGETKESVQAEIEKILESLFADKRLFSVEPYFGLAPAEIAENSRIIGTAIEAEKRCGVFPRISGFEAGCEEGLLQAMGIDAIVLGPGSIKNAHMPDESIEIGELHKAVDIYQAIGEIFLL